MSDERQETIEDIVDDIRAQNQGLPEDSYALSPLVCDLLSIADRIEAAANHQFREVAKMIPHEEVDVSKMETTTPTSDKSSQVGNAAAMREKAKPVRNCDKYKTAKGAFIAFEKMCQSKYCSLCPFSPVRSECMSCMLNWLYADAEKEVK